jgi:hypothetical protein
MFHSDKRTGEMLQSGNLKAAIIYDKILFHIMNATNITTPPSWQ